MSFCNLSVDLVSCASCCSFVLPLTGPCLCECLAVSNNRCIESHSRCPLSVCHMHATLNCNTTACVDDMHEWQLHPAQHRDLGNPLACSQNARTVICCVDRAWLAEFPLESRGILVDINFTPYRQCKKRYFHHHCDKTVSFGDYQVYFNQTFPGLIVLKW